MRVDRAVALAGAVVLMALGGCSSGEEERARAAAKRAQQAKVQRQIERDALASKRWDRGNRDGYTGVARRSSNRSYAEGWTAGHQDCTREARRAVSQRSEQTIGEDAGCTAAVSGRAQLAAMPRTEVRVGAECSDGTQSDATGSGACSYHGGVSFWLTEEQIMSVEEEQAMIEAQRREDEYQAERKRQLEEDRKRDAELEELLNEPAETTPRYLLCDDGSLQLRERDCSP